MKLSQILTLLSILHYVTAAKILGIVPIPSYSHQVTYHPLWKELSLRGHQVTTLTTDPIRDPSLINLTEIDLNFTYEIWKNHVGNFLHSSNTLQLYHYFITTTMTIIDAELSYGPVQDLLTSVDAHFDLVMVEYYMPTMAVFAHKFDCPFIGLTSADLPNFRHRLVGNINHPVLYPDMFLPFSEKLTFFDRLVSVIFSIGIEVYLYLYVNRAEQALVVKHFGENVPIMEDFTKNASLVFINTNPVFHRIRPMVPSVIEIGGGSHRTPSNRLQQNLQKQLDKASQGIIYFSLGTNVKSHHLPKDIQTIILETFEDIPYLVLWKTDSDLDRKPENVMLSTWWPQQDVLKHPNVKLFITQGGLQSTEEAIINKVPMIVLPFVADQPMNAESIVRKGFGISLNYRTLTKQVFKGAILEVINNPRYRNTITKVADLANDRPMNGLEQAIWWTEYVLRHKGAKHLRSSSVDIPYYQYFLLDVIAFLFTLFGIIPYILFVLVHRFLTWRKKSRKLKEKRKRN